MSGSRLATGGATVPAAWLTLGGKVIYSAYDTPQRLWGISALSDQQMAGLIMKLGGSAYLWGVITVMFFKWAARHEAAAPSPTTTTTIGSAKA